jgi:hypothetical protein
MLDETCTIFCKDWNASPSGFFSWSGRLGPGLCITFLSQHLRDIATIDEDVSHEAIVDISSTRDDADWSAAEQFFQSSFGGLATWLVQLRCVDASESDALVPISKRVTINHLDMPTVDRALDATEWCEGLPTEQRSDTSVTGSVRPFGLLVRMESFLTVKSMGIEGAPGSWFRFPAEVTRRAKFGLGCPGS